MSCRGTASTRLATPTVRDSPRPRARSRSRTTRSNRWCSRVPPRCPTPPRWSSSRDHAPARSPPEVDAVDGYLNKGGKILAMVAPPFPAKMQDGTIKRFLARWGVDLGDTLVVELSPIGRLFGIGPEVPIIQQYEPH